jgi:hypothetical protein
MSGGKCFWLGGGVFGDGGQAFCAGPVVLMVSSTLHRRELGRARRGLGPHSNKQSKQKHMGPHYIYAAYPYVRVTQFIRRSAIISNTCAKLAEQEIDSVNGGTFGRRQQ